MKRENKGLTILVVILLIIVVGLGGYITYDKQEGKHNDLEPSDNKSVAKLDDSKDYVYDADYTGVYKNKYTEYTRGTTIKKLSDLKVPYINIASYYAGVANSEFKELYKKYASAFDGCAVNTGFGCSLKLTYKTYRYNNILSIVIANGSQASAPMVLDYKTYNFDLKAGNEITYDEMITRLGYDKNTLLDKEKNLIKTYMDKKVEESPTEGGYDLTKKCGNWSQETDSVTEGNCYEQAYKSLESNTISFFVNEKGNLNFIAKPDTRLYQNSNAEIIFTVEK